MYQLIFHPEADDEFLESFNWYEEQKEGLGIQFMREIERAIKKIEANPLHYKFIRHDFHEILVDIFPFLIIYKVDQKEKVVYIAAIFHTSRHPKQKLRRKF